MKKAPNAEAERWRVAGPVGTNYGSFLVPNQCGPGKLGVLISEGGGWDHVSVSLPARCPTWQEMLNIAALFFDDYECLMQLRVPTRENINHHNYCLHWWRPQTSAEMAACKALWLASGEPWPYPELMGVPGAIPRPQAEMV